MTKPEPVSQQKVTVEMTRSEAVIVASILMLQVDEHMPIELELMLSVLIARQGGKLGLMNLSQKINNIAKDVA